MGIIKRQGIQNSIISYAGVFIGYINIIFLFPRILELDQIGLTRLLPNIAVLIAQFSALGFSSAGIKYFPYFRDKQSGHNNFLLLFLGIPVAGFLLSSGLYWIFKPYILQYLGKGDSLLLQFSHYIIPLSFFTLFFNLFTAYLTSLYKTVVPSFIKDFLLRLGTSFCVLIYYLEWIDFEGFFSLFIALNCGVTLILLVYIIWLKQFRVSLDKAPLLDKPIKPMLRYGLYAFLGTISGQIIILIDSIMIGHYENLDSVGVYVTATNVASVILIVGSSIFKIANPQIADFWKSGNMAGMQKLYKQVTRINLVIGGLIFIGIWANIHNLFDLLPPGFESGKYVVLFVCLARLFDITSGINGYILLTSARYRYDLIFNLSLSVVTVIGNMYLIPELGIIGAALVFLFVSGSINLLRLLSVWIFYKMQPFDISTLKIMAIGLVAFGAGASLPYLVNTLVDLIARSVLMIIIYGICILYFNLAPEITEKSQKFLIARWRK